MAAQSYIHLNQLLLYYFCNHCSEFLFFQTFRFRHRSVFYDIYFSRFLKSVGIKQIQCTKNVKKDFLTVLAQCHGHFTYCIIYSTYYMYTISNIWKSYFLRRSHEKNLFHVIITTYIGTGDLWCYTTAVCKSLEECSIFVCLDIRPPNTRAMIT